MKKIFVIFGVALSVIACKPTNEPEVKTPVITVKITVPNTPYSRDSLFVYRVIIIDEQNNVFEADTTKKIYLDANFIAKDVINLDSMKQLHPQLDMYYGIQTKSKQANGKPINKTFTEQIKTDISKLTKDTTINLGNQGWYYPIE